MLFWCIECEDAFDAEPDAPDLLQSVCRRCKRVCLSFEMELEDAKSIHFSNQVGGSIFSMIFGGFFGIKPGLAESETPKIIRFAEEHEIETDDFAFASESDAERIKRGLGEQGVICGIEKKGEGVRLIVEERDKKRALTFIRDWRSSV